MSSAASTSGGFCPNLPGNSFCFAVTVTGKCLFDTSNGWFLPELARKSFPLKSETTREIWPMWPKKRLSCLVFRPFLPPLEVCFPCASCILPSGILGKNRDFHPSGNIHPPKGTMARVGQNGHRGPFLVRSSKREAAAGAMAAWSTAARSAAGCGQRALCGQVWTEESSLADNRLLPAFGDLGSRIYTVFIHNYGKVLENTACPRISTIEDLERGRKSSGQNTSRVIKSLPETT